MQRAGFILTGGRSSRMGADKALLRWGPVTAVEHLASAAGPSAGSVTLIGEPDRYRHLPFPCLPDLRPGLGPLSGVETALSATAAAWNLILACDLPDATPELMGRLFVCAETSGTRLTLVRDGAGQCHPLCAVYHKRCLPLVQSAIDRRELRLMRLVETLNPAYVDIATAFANINSPVNHPSEKGAPDVPAD